MTLLQHRIIYPDGSEEIIKNYGMFCHSSGGFVFYTTEGRNNNIEEGNPEYIFISGSNVRKIIPLGAV